MAGTGEGYFFEINRLTRGGIFRSRYARAGLKNKSMQFKARHEGFCDQMRAREGILSVPKVRAVRLRPPKSAPSAVEL